jgi:hypothetical protein
VGANRIAAQAEIFLTSSFWSFDEVFEHRRQRLGGALERDHLAGQLVATPPRVDRRRCGR